jgi:hypothetical protein
MRIVLFSILLLHFTGDVFAIGRYNIGDTLQVFALSGIRLRDKPGGTVLTTIPYGSQVVTLERMPGDREETVDGIVGNWVSVSFKGKKGYVFDGYLSILPAPADDIKDIKAYCKRYFRPRGNPIEVKNGEEESTNDIYIQYYVYRDLLIEYRANGYYEGSSETMIIEPIYRVSAEEVFLLGKALFREDVAETIAKMEKGEFDPTEEGGVDAQKRKSGADYFRFLPLKDCQSVTYSFYTEGCSEEFGIGQFEHLVFLRRWGGC